MRRPHQQRQVSGQGEADETSRRADHVAASSEGDDILSFRGSRAKPAGQKGSLILGGLHSGEAVRYRTARAARGQERVLRCDCQFHLNVFRVRHRVPIQDNTAGVRAD